MVLVFDFLKSKLRQDKKGMELEVLGWWIMALAVLIILVIAFFYLRMKGVSAIDYLKALFRMR